MQENPPIASNDPTPPLLLQNVSKGHRAIKVPINKAEDVNSWVTMKAVKKVRRFLDAFSNCLNQFAVKITVHIVSIISCTAQLAFQAYLTHRFRNDSFLISLFGAIFISALFFLTVVSIKLYYITKKKDYTMSMKEFFATSTIIYCSFAIIAIVLLFGQHSDYCIVTSVALFMSYNLLAVHAIISFLLTSVLIFFAVLEAFLRLVTCKFKHVNEFRVITYNSYFYNSSMRQTKSCTICLGDYKDKDLVCIATCYATHIFHERCIVEWVVKHPLCPICRAPAKFM
eukprot:TRINITY_DN6038_c0_g4_i1.p1 TRINITY_DN6038_c0_g4~~TRINITY_DN6038_c0_g4_i1.p1  ORF type:complete len:284 (+),score=58.06 TRINITY_DN6038_c0_g4_i1:109-960(+)